MHVLTTVFCFASADQEQGLLILHVDAVTGKLAAREFTGGSAGSLRPCELKTASLLPNMVAVQCRYTCTYWVP